MATSLEAIRRKLVVRMRTLDAAFDRHALTPTCKKRTDRFALQQGLVATLWQVWCAFCRATIIGSARGIQKNSGHVTSPYAGRSDMEIAYVAKRLANKRTVTVVKELTGMHLEPNWGDLSKVNLIVTGIGSTNGGQLASAFGTGTAILDLQLCRNASAHLNKEGIADMSTARVRYSQTAFVHPSDAIFWIDPSTKDYLWKTWIEEIDVISDLAVA